MSLPDRQYLMQLFRRVDRDGSGSINANELQAALSNGTWTPFNPETVRMMIGMFDRDNSATIDFEEFASLWKYIDDWQKCFRSFDRDNSGSIDKNELKLALTAFGYRLSDQFFNTLIGHLQFKANSSSSAPKSSAAQPFETKILFDDFIFICIKIQTLTNAFRKFDYQQNGVITIKYEDFLSLVFSLKI
ncbi:programmed cell death 6 isoform X2 [Brachionus plicatilis]|uniref:Programmed cell death 6 isoform X2 n=1 Tax=Brachionus plicatilis TaxID=10195 RepID=A0A3M7PXW6_BRAPC|nr:programmed cell death 6 isoform X2 [Brachionus plicatilis]